MEEEITKDVLVLKNLVNECNFSVPVKDIPVQYPVPFQWHSPTPQLFKRTEHYQCSTQWSFVCKQRKDSSLASIIFFVFWCWNIFQCSYWCTHHETLVYNPSQCDWKWLLQWLLGLVWASPTLVNWTADFTYIRIVPYSGKIWRGL